MSEEIKDSEVTEKSIVVEGELSELLQKIEELQSQVDSYKDKYIRSAAEFENLKKRNIKEKEELRKLLVSGFIDDLLPVLDGFNAGMDSATKATEVSNIIEGFQMVSDQLFGMLERLDVKQLNPLNEVFDPNFHECVAQMPSDEIPEGNVLDVIRVGYAFKDRLIRAATVVVSSGASSIKE